MSENMIILDLLENSHITFEEALILINAIRWKSQAMDIHHLPRSEGEKGIKVNISFERLMDV